MTVEIQRGKKVISATMDSPLKKREVAIFLNFRRQQMTEDVARGYVMLYGTTTTPRHYLNWLAQNPRPEGRGGARVRQEKEQRLERELSRLR